MAKRPISELLNGVTRFGKLTLLGEAEPTATMRRGLFRCDCGNVKPMALHHIKHGRTVSCGCESAKRSSSRFTKHGAYRTATYRSWKSMMQRCHNPNCNSFEEYGARGITVAPEWHGSDGFHRFLAYMGPRPAGTTLDRIDNDGLYRPGNVRWATPKAQQNNRRVSRLLAYKGRTMNARDWAAELGMGRNTIDERLRAGWSVERALTEPVHACGANVGRKTA